MSGWLQALILGVIQGLTEFLPVSSSGHLVLAQAWFGDAFLFHENAVAFDLVLHLGTLIPVVVFYRRSILALARSPFTIDDVPGTPWIRQPDRWLLLMVIVASVPTGIMGIAFKDLFERVFHDVTTVATALFITGIILFTTRLARKREGGTIVSIPVALAIGVAQGFAITPGISRSGTTIAVALLLGLNRDLAARFSFLLSIPAILGGLLLVMKDGVSFPTELLGSLAVGFLSAMVVGYMALVALVALVRLGGLHRFSFYLWPLAILGWLSQGIIGSS